MQLLRIFAAAVAGLALLVPAVGWAASREVAKEGTASVKMNLSGLANPLLNTFQLRFTNGDHELRRIGIRARTGEATAVLEDQNGDDPIAFEGRFVGDLPIVMKGSATAECRGVCTVTIDKPPASATVGLALMGFELERLDGDSNVKKISIRPTADQFAYRVEYVDNGLFDYRVTIHFAWVGKRWGEETVKGRRTAFEGFVEVAMSDASRMPSVLRGFSFAFDKGDHHLREIAVLQNDQLDYEVRFNDNNTDDPISAELDLLMLRW